MTEIWVDEWGDFVEEDKENEYLWSLEPVRLYKHNSGSDWPLQIVFYGEGAHYRSIFFLNWCIF